MPQTCQCPDCRAARDLPLEEQEQCPDCGSPLPECSCVSCSRCGGTTREACPDCGRGSCCCRCNAPEPAYRQPDGRFWGDPGHARYPRYVGVEIECYVVNGNRRNMTACATKWGAGIESDGSIRPDEGYGVEYVTAPARGDAFIAQLHETCDMLHAQGARVNRSCGAHVHVDARDFSPENTIAFARLYSRVEKRLFALVARARRTNDYCRPWGDRFEIPHHTSEGRLAVLDTSKAITAREKALDVATYGSEDEARYAKEARSKHSSRYHGVNFNALAVHGTIEFRLHHGTVNEHKLAHWAAICSALVQYAKDHSETEIMALRGTPAEILDKVCNDPGLAAWCRERQRHFETLDRRRRGLAPRARARAAAPAPAPEVPTVPPEGGEDAATPPRARRAYR